jgi:hypothetical protein
MRLYAFLVGVGGTDPCWFVGLRFAKAPSNSVSDICDGLFLEESSGAVVPEYFRSPSSIQLSRNHAAILKQEYLAPHYVLAEAALEVDVVLSLIGDIILPHVRRILYREIPITEASVLEAMNSVDQAFLSGTSMNSAAFESFRDAILASTEWKSLLHLWELSADWTENIPHGVDISTGLTAEWAHFFLGILSVLGPLDGLDLEDDRYDSLKTSATMRNVIFRNQSKREANFMPLKVADISPHDALRISQSIEYLSENIADAQTAWFVAIFLESIPMNGWSDLSRMGASQAMLSVQIKEALCPRLIGIVNGSEERGFPTKTAANLIVGCSESYPEFAPVLRASIVAGFEGQFDPLLDSGDVDRLVNALVFPNFPWISGLNPSFHDPQRKVIVGRLLVRFIELFQPFSNDTASWTPRFKSRWEFDTLVDFESVMRGLGRVIGMSIRVGTPLGDQFLIPHSLFYGLKSGFDFASGITPHEREFNFEEPAFFVRRGIVDSIGPGGLYMFSIDRWVEILL